MKWFVGVDGGGTKTEFVVSHEDATPILNQRNTGCSYQSIGIDATVALIAEGVKESLAAAGAPIEDCAGCCAGVPCYGENTEADLMLLEKLRAALDPIPIYLTNDVEVGWAGALECQEGIHIVAGTGSIALGRGADKKTARSGGWVEFFGDEGSCYWVGREAMSLFSKEADGRAPRGALYDEVRQVYQLGDDYRFVDVVLRDIAPHRERVAAFQRCALRAAKKGDTAVIRIYEAAADELALMAQAIKQKLVFTPGVTPVSYSGGLFKSGELILQPLRSKVEAIGCTLQEPKRSAAEGALILGIEHFNGRK